MCGIVGYIGKKNSLPILIKGLRRLEYRGYDSAGVAYIKNGDIKTVKTVGRIDSLDRLINYDDESFVGIGHTRWATHGGVDTINSHPHQVGSVTIVHNGILENYQELKDRLVNNGYAFKSDTDTEVLCAYIDYEYNKTKDMLDALNNCMEVFEGSYATAIMVKDIPDKLFVMKKDSPLVIGIGESENYIASDISAYSDETSAYIILEDMEIGMIDCDNISIYKGRKEIKYDIEKVDQAVRDNNKENYEHYMLKEIFEQNDLITRLNHLYLENLDRIMDISNYNKIHIIGCGTAFHAGMIGKYLIENYSDFEVNAYIASEYRYQKIFVDDKTLVIAASQSGETADTLACIKRVKEYGCKTLGIVNVKNSSIARAVDEVIYTEAGQEVAVASTKAYSSQVYIFSLLALKLGLAKGIVDKNEVIKEYDKLPEYICNMTNYDYDELIEKIWKSSDVFYLGRGIDYISMLEGSLKLKEISYVHSEAYQAGELKHGTISLIEDRTPIIALISDEATALKTISNIKEVKARGAYVILLIRNGLNINIDKACYDKMILINDIHYLLQPILNVIPLQLIAYHVAKKRGCDIDKPRNLAKSVTVE